MSTHRYISVCSGIEAATCAWHPLGWRPLAFAEIVGCLSDGAHNGGGLNGQDAYTGRILPTTGMAVRRLTPVECERLQGFPDGFTDIRANGKPTPDGPRYKALGNSMAVPCMAWIGKRIAAVDSLFVPSPLDAALTPA